MASKIPFDIILDGVRNSVQDNNKYLETGLVFQQDGAPPHYAATVRQYLDETFLGQWIERRGAIEWPPRSLDLTPLDFLWGHLKTQIYASQPTSFDNLKQRIIDECRQITPEVFQNVRERFEQNLYYCMEVEGQNF